jgi:hypothetical protein
MNLIMSKFHARQIVYIIPCLRIVDIMPNQLHHNHKITTHLRYSQTPNHKITPHPQYPPTPHPPNYETPSIPYTPNSPSSPDT